MEFRPGAQTTRSLKHTQCVLEGFSTLWLCLDWGKIVKVLSCRHIQGSVHPMFWQGKASGSGPSLNLSYNTSQLHLDVRDV